MEVDKPPKGEEGGLTKLGNLLVSYPERFVSLQIVSTVVLTGEISKKSEETPFFNWLLDFSLGARTYVVPAPYTARVARAPGPL